MPGRHRWVEHAGVLVPPRTASLWRKIEAEFDEPIRDLLLGFRADGYTWATIAGILGLGKGGNNRMVRWRKLLGIYERSNPVKYEPEVLPCDRKAQALGYKNAREAVTELRLQGLTYYEIRDRLGISLFSIYRYGDIARKLMPITPKMREYARQLWRTRKNKPTKDHIWRRT